MQTHERLCSEVGTKAQNPEPPIDRGVQTHARCSNPPAFMPQNAIRGCFPVYWGFEAFTLGDGANLLTLLPIASVSRVLFHVQRVLSHGRVWSKKGINNLI